MSKELALRELVADEALRWLGVPYAHQHRGRFVDCLGLVICVGRRAKVLDLDESDPRWAKYKNYGPHPQPLVMQEGLELLLCKIPRDAFLLGDVIWLKDAGQPRHLGIVTHGDSFVHADIGAGKVERYPLRAVPAGFVRSAFRYPSIQEACDE